MDLKNSNNGYGLVSVLLHWLIALTIFFLFGLGLWMVELDYYDAWYRKGPDLHKSIGILLFITVVMRIAWRLVNVRPEPVGNTLEQSLARWVHRILLILPLFIMVSGYLISTADGSSIDVFSFFTVPATVSGFEGQEDIAGDVHFILALVLISVAVIHVLAAMKHQFLDKDGTISRIFGIPSKG